MALFTPFTLRGLTLKNRIAVSPMCQYSALDGLPNDWHMVHLGSRAVGGAALVMTEASAVVAEGRISPGDAGIYNDAHVAAWQPITRFIKSQGAVAAMQLAHAGRKASTDVPWRGGKPITLEHGGWAPIPAPSALAFSDGYQVPHEMSLEQIRACVAAFGRAAQRALEAGFSIVEVHAAHGYLVHEFLSPLSNHRTDQYGGSFDNRTRLLREITVAIREVWPENLPLFVRISATDWVDGGWDIEQSIALAKQLKPLGVDLIDVSSGGNVAHVKIPVGPGYQVPFAARIRREAEIPTIAVGMITESLQAEAIIETGEADMVMLARELLRDPYWPRRAAHELGVTLPPPDQYQRAW
ncbi:NADH:flavin oxidoreductase/NADH oxidase [Pseudolysobacter antarcticus]|uniref:NADH:flavin oxidoreductase/NADH oxidase n=1 Tax=Pseudolysobacter antarcticus TaxID=2511995 RepID=A0A411HJ78_9GAMM|nr:NADH:flavin oxidoreductase/NADH oxidase [Pseudolysobacter antarcticus]QBB70553.1 NADH:flavin oxidoreductase/NADH oxidase [Pseudolysobacter antarcticus]